MLLYLLQDLPLGGLKAVVEGVEKKLSFSADDVLTKATMLVGDKVQFKISTNLKTKAERAVNVEILADTFECDHTEEQRKINTVAGTGYQAISIRRQTMFTPVPTLDSPTTTHSEKVFISVPTLEGPATTQTQKKITIQPTNTKERMQKDTGINPDGPKTGTHVQILPGSVRAVRLKENTEDSNTKTTEASGRRSSIHPNCDHGNQSRNRISDKGGRIDRPQSYRSSSRERRQVGVSKDESDRERSRSRSRERSTGNKRSRSSDRVRDQGRDRSHRSSSRERRRGRSKERWNRNNSRSRSRDHSHRSHSRSHSSSHSSSHSRSRSRERGGKIGQFEWHHTATREWIRRETSRERSRSDGRSRSRSKELSPRNRRSSSWEGSRDGDRNRGRDQDRRSNQGRNFSSECRDEKRQSSSGEGSSRKRRRSRSPKIEPVTAKVRKDLSSSKASGTTNYRSPNPHAVEDEEGEDLATKKKELEDLDALIAEKLAEIADLELEMTSVIFDDSGNTIISLQQPQKDKNSPKNTSQPRSPPATSTAPDVSSSSSPAVSSSGTPRPENSGGLPPDADFDMTPKDSGNTIISLQQPQKDVNCTKNTAQPHSSPSTSTQKRIKPETYKTVWMCGYALSGLARWMATAQKHASKLGNNSPSIRVQHLGGPGMTWTNLVLQMHELKSNQPYPDMLIIHLGSNNIMTKKEDLLNTIKKDLTLTHNIFPQCQIVWSDMVLMPFYKQGMTLSNKADEAGDRIHEVINRTAHAIVHDLGGRVITHDNIGPELYSPSGNEMVISDKGIKRFNLNILQFVNEWKRQVNFVSAHTETIPKSPEPTNNNLEPVNQFHDSLSHSASQPQSPPATSTAPDVSFSSSPVVSSSGTPRPEQSGGLPLNPADADLDVTREDSGNTIISPQQPQKDENSPKNSSQPHTLPPTSFVPDISSSSSPAAGDDMDVTPLDTATISPQQQLNQKQQQVRESNESPVEANQTHGSSEPITGPVTKTCDVKGPPKVVWMCGFALSGLAKRITSAQNQAAKLGNTCASMRVHQWGTPQMTWTELVIEMCRFKRQQPRPDMLLIHLGGRNVDLSYPHSSLNSIRNDLGKTHRIFPQCLIVWSNILPGGSRIKGMTDEATAKAINKINHKARSLITDLGGRVITHQDIGPELHLSNGLSKQVIEMFKENIRKFLHEWEMGVNSQSELTDTTSTSIAPPTDNTGPTSDRSHRSQNASEPHSLLATSTAPAVSSSSPPAATSTAPAVSSSSPPATTSTAPAVSSSSPPAATSTAPAVSSSSPLAATSTAPAVSSSAPPAATSTAAAVSSSSPPATTSTAPAVSSSSPPAATSTAPAVSSSSPLAATSTAPAVSSSAPPAATSTAPAVSSSAPHAATSTAPAVSSTAPPAATSTAPAVSSSAPPAAGDDVDMTPEDSGNTTISHQLSQKQQQVRESNESPVEANQTHGSSEPITGPVTKTCDVKGPPKVVWMCGFALSNLAKRITSAQNQAAKLGNTCASMRVHQWGTPQMTWTQQVIEMCRFKRQQPRPDMLLIHLGGRNVDLRNPHCSLKSIRKDLGKTHRIFPQCLIVWSDMLPGGSWKFKCMTDEAATKAINKINHGARSLITDLGGRVITHQDIGPELHLSNGLSKQVVVMFKENIRKFLDKWEMGVNPESELTDTIAPPADSTGPTSDRSHLSQNASEPHSLPATSTAPAVSSSSPPAATSTAPAVSSSSPPAATSTAPAVSSSAPPAATSTAPAVSSSSPPAATSTAPAVSSSSPPAATSTAPAVSSSAPPAATSTAPAMSSSSPPAATSTAPAVSSSAPPAATSTAPAVSSSAPPAAGDVDMTPEDSGNTTISHQLSQKTPHVPQSKDISSITVKQSLSAEKSSNTLKPQKEDVCKLEVRPLSASVTDIKAISTESKTRELFLKCYRLFTLNPNTAHKKLYLTENNRKVEWSDKDQPYPYHPRRYAEKCFQVLCWESISERRYFEVEWSGSVCISLSFDNQHWKKRVDVMFGSNILSWALKLSRTSCCVYHNDEKIKVPQVTSSRIGVCVDYRAGTLAFYSVTDTVTLIWKVQNKFSYPLFPGFGLGQGSSVKLL
ncbi:uncharacterized protein LOC125311866 [Alosa alosa]|uniref:uncharacterized protein LOC125311866 n=1 Tax=Alosa alosa TaxID=278164 RepID=UPI0020152ABD|nr:uncharacterized protein LOC125311866 [Alosa alosa]